jgi:hypothetical protein
MALQVDLIGIARMPAPLVVSPIFLFTGTILKENGLAGDCCALAAMHDSNNNDDMMSAYFNCSFCAAFRP